MLSTIGRVTLLVLATLSVDVPEARACSYLSPDPYVYANEAPPGGLFVLRIPDEFSSDALESPLALTLRGVESSPVEVEIVRHVGVTLVVRVPFEQPIGYALLEGVPYAAYAYDFRFGSSEEGALSVHEGPVLDHDAPTLDELSIVFERNRVRGPSLVSVPVPLTDSSCGPDSLSVGEITDHSTAFAEISGPSVEETDFLVDVWVTNEGATLDTSSLPDIAGQSLYFLVDDASPTGTVHLPLPVGAGDTRDVHVRLTDPRTGLTSEIRTATVSVPDDEPMGVGCASTRCHSSDAPLNALVLGICTLAAFRRRRRCLRDRATRRRRLR